MVWEPSSWRSKPVTQDVHYPPEAQESLAKTLSKLRTLPPLVAPSEIDRLRSQLADVALGKAFLLQGGDCAETFADCSQHAIESRVSLILLMSLTIIWGARLPVVRIYRGAGQYAKPRSKPTEMHNGQEILSFRGDNVNGIEPSDRMPNPERLIGAYFHSSATLNFIRALLASGFAGLHNPRSWSLSHVRSPKLQAAFEEIVDRLEDSLDFMRVIDAAPSREQGSKTMSTLNTVDLFTSHEALLLEYEESLTRPWPCSLAAQGLMPPRRDPRSGYSTPNPQNPPLHSQTDSDRDTKENPSLYYNSSAHFIWIGDRTRQLDGAHVEYFRGIANPIGIKCGPTMESDELVRLLDVVDPDKVSGRVTLICRYGANMIESCLPAHIDAVKKSGHCVVFACDPMHGNTKPSVSRPDVKTRHMPDVVTELSSSFRIHNRMASRLGGVHLEMTGETNEDGYSVTECLGGSMELEEQHLDINYQTYCDPRLNYEQSIDVAFLISRYFQNERRGRADMDDIMASLGGAHSDQ